MIKVKWQVSNRHEVVKVTSLNDRQDQEVRCRQKKKNMKES